MSLFFSLDFNGDVFVTLLFQAALCCDGGWWLRLLHIAVGGACLLLVLAATALSEKQLLHFIRTHLLSQYRKKTT